MNYLKGMKKLSHIPFLIAYKQVNKCCTTLNNHHIGDTVWDLFSYYILIIVYISVRTQSLLYIHCSTFLKFPVSLNNLHLWLNCTDIHFRRASINPERVPSNPSSVIHGAVSRVPGLIDLPFD